MPSTSEGLPITLAFLLLHHTYELHTGHVGKCIPSRSHCCHALTIWQIKNVISLIKVVIPYITSWRFWSHLQHTIPFIHHARGSLRRWEIVKRWLSNNVRLSHSISHYNRRRTSRMCHRLIAVPFTSRNIFSTVGWRRSRCFQSMRVVFSNILAV